VLNKMDLVNPLWAKTIAGRFMGVVCSAINQDTLGDLLKEVENKMWGEESSGFVIQSSA
jgi:hypothetical protein